MGEEIFVLDGIFSDETGDYPADEKFLPHRHYGGEEILILSGVFQDEYGEYPKGTLPRSPHLSVHHPYVSEETLILVKTGHLITV
jgi:anti-sigma factor ChrR (cupin superfamily)